MPGVLVGPRPKRRVLLGQPHAARMPNQVPPWVEGRMIAFALGHPGLGRRRFAAQLALPTWRGLVILASGVLKVLTDMG